MSEHDPENTTQREVAQDAAASDEDPVTKREALEQDLMAEGASDEGEELGDEMP